jgi:membrane-bound lytic murein transglycosylase D
VAVNNLRSRHEIRAGQVLVLPDNASGGNTSVAVADLPAGGTYRVRSGDNLSLIARRYGVSEAALVAENGLRNRNQISVGQELRIPKDAPVVVAAASPPAPKPAKPPAPVKPVELVEVVETVATVETAETVQAIAPVPAVAPVQVLASAEPADSVQTVALAASSVPAQGTPLPVAIHRNAPAPDPSDYAVDSQHRITVQAAETLGHYAEWLEVSSSHLRRLNGMRSGSAVAIGRKAKMDFSQVTPQVFERRRLAYHHALQEEYFAAFEVIGTRTHTLRSGDTLWLLAEQKYQVPVWLIRQYNPDLDFTALRVGTRMVIPEVGERSS